MSAVDLQPVFVARAADPMLPDWYRIQRVRRENHDTFTLELAAQVSKDRSGHSYDASRRNGDAGDVAA